MLSDRCIMYLTNSGVQNQIITSKKAIIKDFELMKDTLYKPIDSNELTLILDEIKKTDELINELINDSMTDYDKIKTRVSKGKKEVIREHATKNGESLNGFINRAIDETMERDKAQG